VVLIEHDKNTGVCRLVREPQDLAERVAELLSEGNLQKDIAKELDISPVKVNRIVQKLRKQQQAEPQREAA
jgi:DNA-binding transcriptional regulator LsrR (DeoR family)